jgi:DNA polymerase-3 subunit alpha
MPAAKANELFDLIDKFAGYGFNKSHAAAYALVAYQTAWVKAHHKPEFFAASMAYDIHLTDKLAIFVDDMRRIGVPCLPPCINASVADFSVEGISVRYALAALKGVGEKAMEELCEERTATGPFKDLNDFADRVDPSRRLAKQCSPLPRRSSRMRPWHMKSERAPSMISLDPAGLLWLSRSACRRRPTGASPSA